MFKNRGIEIIIDLFLEKLATFFGLVITDLGNFGRLVSYPNRKISKDLNDSF